MSRNLEFELPRIQSEVPTVDPRAFRARRIAIIGEYIFLNQFILLIFVHPHQYWHITLTKFLLNCELILGYNKLRDKMGATGATTGTAQDEWTIRDDDATKAKKLLDSISILKTTAEVLGRLKTKVAGEEQLTVQDVRDVETIVAVLEEVHTRGRKQVAAVSPVSYLLRAYDMVARKDEQENRCPNRISKDTWKLKSFLDPKKDASRTTPASPSSILNDKRSERLFTSPPSKSKEEEEVERLLKGIPPHPLKTWTKMDLIDAMVILSPKMLKNKFVKKVVQLGNSPYTSPGSIYRMFNAWKSSNAEPREKGRPLKMSVPEAEKEVVKVFQDKTTDSSAFVLKDMKEAFKRKMKDKAEQDGFDPGNVSEGSSNTLAKTMMVASAMSTEVGTFTTKKLLPKTEKRFQSEHSLMMGYSYAATVLATHFIEGPVPTKLKNYKYDNLNRDARESVDWMKSALQATEIYPVNPNLVMSTDDSTMFAMEGVTNDAGDWDWKIVPTYGDSSVRSDFKVSDHSIMNGLRIRITVTMTASGLTAPPYITVDGLTAEELCPILCEDGILATEVPGLCKGGDNIANSGSGWLVFLRADAKEKEGDDTQAKLSIANKKFMQYNDDVMLPFIREIRKTLGWKEGQPVADSMKCVSWCDGDIGQLQTMLFESREVADEVDKICRNKHAAAATGTQQPCDLSPVFRNLKQILKKSTAKGDTACGLVDTLQELFANVMRRKGLNLDGNYRKKRALMDFLVCLPEMLEACLKKAHIKQSFVEAGMIDAETGTVPVFEKLLGTCKRYVSLDSNIGIKKWQKEHCRSQFPHLMRLQLANNEITYPEMREVGIPVDLDSKGSPVSEDRPSGPHAEHRQPSKTINGAAQKRMRAEMRRTKLAEAHRNAVVSCTTINDVLQRNHDVENLILSKSAGETPSLAQATCQHFMQLNANQLQDFIHARMFEGKSFQKTQIAGTDGKLNKTRYRAQTATDIEQDCSKAEPCLVWYAWILRDKDLVLQHQDMPVLDTTFATPTFEIVYARPTASKKASEYLSNDRWIESFSSLVKGVSIGNVSDELRRNADLLASAMEPRLDLHIAERVHVTRRNHVTLTFTRDNLPAMAAAMCLSGHIVANIANYRLDERLLVLPILAGDFQTIADDLQRLEGCYLYFDKQKLKWIRSGKTSGEGKDACFEGRGKKHRLNSASKDQMRMHRLYREYPASGVDDLGVAEGTFNNLTMYCGMAYDKKGDTGALRSRGTAGSLFVWRQEIMDELNKKGGDLKKLQLDAVAYLWELAYDLVLAKSENVSTSPGFESLGLRVNNDKKRKRDER